MEGLKTGVYYHINNHANGMEVLYRSDENKRFFLKKYRKYIVPVADTIAYCLMSNHFHFLIKTKSVEEFLNQNNYEHFIDFICKNASLLI